MIYKHDLSKEREFLKNHYLKMGIPAFIAVVVYFLLISFVFSKNENLEHEKWILYFSFSIAVFVLLIIFIACKGIIQKQFRNFSLEISESELKYTNGKVQRTIKIDEIAKIKYKEGTQIIISDFRANTIYMDKYIENLDELENFLNSLEIPKQNTDALKKNKIRSFFMNPNFIVVLIILIVFVFRILRILL